MKLRNKTLVMMTFSTLLFIALLFPFITFPHSLPATLAIILFTSCIIGFSTYLIYNLIIKRIEQITQSLITYNLNNQLIAEFYKKNQDEISILAFQINCLQNFTQISGERTAELINQNKILEDKNNSLQQHIHQQKQKDLTLNSDSNVLTHIAYYDDLTGLPNHVLFNEILNKAINHANRHKKTIAVLMIDIDQFKSIHESLGIEKSSYILKELSQRFTNTLRSEDILAKLDGDEFIILLEDIKKPKFASTVAEKLLKICTHLLKIDSQEFTLTASIGISIYPHDGSSLEELLKNTDTALYKAKHLGGNNYQFYATEINLEAREYIQLGTALRTALHNNELTLFYQPRLNLQAGKLIGLETLMRWHHPTLGIIHPAKFIPLAEETGLMMEIGEWALRNACRTLKFWQDEGYEHVSVTVKLSPKQFYHPDISKTIRNVLKSTGLNAVYLELEISESIVMNNIEVAEKILNDIKATGAQISIGHFGTGYTSISYLKQFPINSIKIDKSFIQGIPNYPNDSIITSAMISLVHHLGLEVIAEGVETAEQVQFLSLHQCDIIQGYYLSHPVPAQKIILQIPKLSDTVLI